MRLLGKGGNAAVYAAEREGKTFALKVLQRTSGDGYQRFRDEVATNRRVGDLPGVLPMIDAHLPDQPSKGDPAWIAMPIATPIAGVLDRAPLDVVVTAVQEVANTLALLHSRGIYHRDVKPGNCYRWEDRYVVGDFGLAKFPDKQDLTRSDKKLGPANFHAPEMLTDPRGAAPQPADVWSLAKTLWVLAAGVEWPPPGHQRADDPAATLDSFVEHERLLSLNRLIERATRLTPTARPTMQEFSDELVAWLAPIPEPEGPLDFSDLGQRFAPVLQGIERDQQRRDALEKEARRLTEMASPYLDQIAKALPTYLPISRGRHALTPDEVHNSSPIVIARMGDHSDVIVNVNDRLFVAAIVASVSDNEKGAFSGVCAVMKGSAFKYRWVEHRMFELGSAVEVHLVKEAADLLKARIREAIETLLKDA